MDRTDAIEFDWEAVEPREGAPTKDALGLTDEDRLALGLTPGRTLGLAPAYMGDAEEALREAVLRTGAAVTKMRR